jgi:hypothetical protein
VPGPALGEWDSGHWIAGEREGPVNRNAFGRASAVPRPQTRRGSRGLRRANHNQNQSLSEYPLLHLSCGPRQVVFNRHRHILHRDT